MDNSRFSLDAGLTGSQPNRGALRRRLGKIKRIGIIGAGIAGLHLGLRLRQLNIDCTILTDRSPSRWRRHSPRGVPEPGWSGE
jgi:hypothetical protein